MKQNAQTKPINWDIAKMAIEIYENNKNSNDLYEHKNCDNSAIFVVDVLERVFNTKLNKMREKADFCPSFFDICDKQLFGDCFVIEKADKIQIGDIVFIGFNPYGVCEHCGIAVEISSELVTIVEWDTSHIFDVNGGKLMKKIRHKSLVCGIGRIHKV